MFSTSCTVAIRKSLNLGDNTFRSRLKHLDIRYEHDCVTLLHATDYFSVPARTGIELCTHRLETFFPFTSISASIVLCPRIYICECKLDEDAFWAIFFKSWQLLAQGTIRATCAKYLEDHLNLCLIFVCSENDIELDGARNLFKILTKLPHFKRYIFCCALPHRTSMY